MIGEGKGRRLDQNDIATMKALRHDEHLTYDEICNKMGISKTTVKRYLSEKGKNSKEHHTTVEMLELRQKGLSNSQIALELGISYDTVLGHIGKQKKGARAQYGSIVSHAEGEKFDMEGFRPCSARVAEEESKCNAELLEKHSVPVIPVNENQKETEKQPKPSRKGLTVVSTITTYQGAIAQYTVDSDGYIDLQFAGEDTHRTFGSSEFAGFLEELMDLIDKIPQK